LKTSNHTWLFSAQTVQIACLNLRLFKDPVIQQLEQVMELAALLF
jgi:hypothetical protein